MDEQFVVDGALEERPTKLPTTESNDRRENLDVETLVKQICDELDCAADRAVVDRVVQDMVSHFRHARVKTFVPIFVKRDAVNLLRRK